MSLARVGTPTQAIPSRLQRADASFELAPNTAMMITGMYMAILNNTVHLVQVSCLIERGLGNPIMKPRRRRISPKCWGCWYLCRVRIRPSTNQCRMTQYVLAGNVGPQLDIAPEQDGVRIPIEKWRGSGNDAGALAHKTLISGFGTFVADIRTVSARSPLQFAECLA